jgi:hypothetical protein
MKKNNTTRVKTFRLSQVERRLLTVKPACADWFGQDDAGCVNGLKNAFEVNTPSNLTDQNRCHTLRAKLLVHYNLGKKQHAISKTSVSWMIAHAND